MKYSFVLMILFSLSAFADQGVVEGEVFHGGFVYSKKNYTPVQFEYERISETEISIQLEPTVETDKCIKTFWVGTLVSSNPILFSNSTNYKYRIPVVDACGGKIREYKLEIAFFNETQKVKRVYLSPYPNKSTTYFSTEF